MRKQKDQMTLAFYEEERLKKTTHGGKKSNEKGKRPFIPDKWMHISNKSSLAVGALSMLHFRNKIEIEKIVIATAKKHFITLREFINMGNHYHMDIKAKRREDLQKFLKEVNSKIAKLVMKAKKGQAKGKFWNGLTFSRVLTTAMEALTLKGYFNANKIERQQGKETRELYLKQFGTWVRTLKTRQGYQTLKKPFKPAFIS